MNNIIVIPIEVQLIYFYKKDRHDITEILLKVVLNNHNPNLLYAK